MNYQVFHQYDRFPAVHIHGSEQALDGWDAILNLFREQTRSSSRHVLVCEEYPGADHQVILSELQRLHPVKVFDTTDLLLPVPLLFDRLYKDQGEDRVFGYMTHAHLSDCFDADRMEAARREISSVPGGLILVCGTGASLLTCGNTLLYVNITRWEIQLRYRAGQGNWGLDNGSAPLLTKYKYGYFVLWRLADRLKASLFADMDWMMDANCTESPKMISGSGYRQALDQAARQPFRTRPYFDPGVWGGQWLRKTLGIPTHADNLAWGFDGVPEENALGLTFGDVTLEVPCLDLVLTHPHELLGERVHGRFGAEFPIRFDFLDTMEGGNLSLQVHPLTEYIQQTFGMHYTQDESYYILEADEEKHPTVCLGVRKGIKPGEMLADLQAGQRGEQPFPAGKYINHIPVKKHDHLLIPAGTIHCSGANTVVLEISATPYIFTFKLWDWGRLGLDGLPRPIHLEHGAKNIQWDRDTDWVYDQLVNHIEVLHNEDGVLIERTGLHPREFLETVRYTLSRPWSCDCKDSVHMLNLVDGAEMQIESTDGSFEPYTVHYAETVIVPACVRRFRLCPTGEGKEIKVIDACVR